MVIMTSSSAPKVSTRLTVGGRLLGMQTGTIESLNVDQGRHCEDTRSVTTDIDDEETIRHIVERLEKKFPDIPRAEIADVARAEFTALSDRPVRNFLTILTERAAKKRLKKSVDG